MKYVLVCCSFIFLFLGCVPEKDLVHDAENDLYLVPFKCAYFGLPIAELSECALACPAAFREAYDVEKFTKSLRCQHPKYERFECEVDL